MPSGFRRFKQIENPDGTITYIIKNRMWGRGFLDGQRLDLQTRSTTATRLSQRLVINLSVVFGFAYETWDISGAFLKGLTFQELMAKLKELGHEPPQRQVLIVPPRNAWRLPAQL